jgi:hypothetical protein
MSGIATSEESSPKTIRITLIMKIAFLGEDKFIKTLHEKFGAYRALFLF